ncbi:MAG: hypothetical protein R3Y50_11005 [Rikenellaceae bacterium]
MAYLDILPTTNLKAVDIRDTIGSTSNNLSHYCCKAKSGGSGGYAFNIVENGGTPDDGELIGTPYFNIYSNEAPGEWTKSGTTLTYKLKRNSYGDITVDDNTFTSSSYCFDLGSFAGYKHGSSAPYPSSSSKIQAVGTSSTGYTIWVGNIFPGDYDWAKIAVAEGYSRSDLYYSLDIVNKSSGAKETISHVEGETMIQIDNVSGGVAISYTGSVPSTSANLEIKLAMYRKSGSSFGLLYYIPTESSATGNSGGGVSVDVDVSIDSGYVMPYISDVVVLYSEDGNHYNYQYVSNLVSGAGNSVSVSADIEMAESIGSKYNGYVEYDGQKVYATSAYLKALGVTGDGSMYAYSVTATINFSDTDFQGGLALYIY